MNKKYRVVTLGCRTNQYESQGWKDQLSHMGFSAAKEGEEAELCIVNTCTVTESADSSSRAEIRRLIRENRGAKVVVTGCSVERQPDAIRSIDGVTHLIPNLEKEALVEALYPELEILEFSIENFDAHTRAFVKVQDGCNSFCTYCIIPYVRGRSRSRKLDDILKEVEGLVANGYKEIVLTGINIGDFDGQGTSNLAELVREVDNIDGVKRLRVSSIDPDEVDDALLSAIVDGKHTCHSMHIVLQSGSNVILKKMNRKYTRQIFQETVERLKAASNTFTFTTDVIVGFPGETEVDFQETLSVIHEVEFAKVHLFPYSPRPRTRAAQYPKQVASDTKKRWKRELMKASERVAYQLRERYVGQEMVVLTEQDGGGHTDNFLYVHLDSSCGPNELVRVKLMENRPSGFLGEICTSK